MWKWNPEKNRLKKTWYLGSTKVFGSVSYSNCWSLVCCHQEWIQINMLHWQVKTSIRPRESYKQELPMTLILEALNSLQFWSLNAFLSTKICTSSMPPGLSRARQKVLSQVSLRLLNSVMCWKVEILVGIFFRGISTNPVWKNDIFQEMMELGELLYLIMYTMYKYYGWIIKQIIWFMKIAVPKMCQTELSSHDSH